MSRSNAHDENTGWPLSASSQYVDVDGAACHVQQLGAGPEMLLIHGTGASVHSWAGIVKRLQSHFRMTAFDLPGHGDSESITAADMSLRGLAARTGRLLQRLDLAPSCIVGHSAGAAIALRLVLDGAVAPQMIVALNGALLPFRGLSALLFPLGARLASCLPPIANIIGKRARRAGTVEKMLNNVGGRPPVESIERYRSLIGRRKHVQAAIDMMARWDLEPLLRDLSRLSVPLELVACGQDLAVAAEEAWTVAGRTDMARVHYLRGLGHLAHEEAPDILADLIIECWRVNSRAAGVACVGGRSP